MGLLVDARIGELVMLGKRVGFFDGRFVGEVDGMEVNTLGRAVGLVLEVGLEDGESVLRGAVGLSDCFGVDEGVLDVRKEGECDGIFEGIFETVLILEGKEVGFTDCTGLFEGEIVSFLEGEIDGLFERAAIFISLIDLFLCSFFL